LERIVILNLHQYDGSGDRKGVTVHLEKLGSIKQVEVRRLHAEAGTAAGGFDVNQQNITYAGQQWSYEVDQDKGARHGSD
jgi:hypothetical protein